jgi:hypothetical protein
VLRWRRVRREVQEVQERMNALQQELKRRSAHAEAARNQALAVLRKQTALREARSARCDPGRCTSPVFGLSNPSP